MKKFIALCMLSISGAAMADTLPLPDPTVAVTTFQLTTTTIVTVAGVTYQGASQFVYVSECTTPDSYSYHCNILRETGVVLYSATGSSVTVSLTIQDGSRLVRSGHNYFKHFSIVLDGELVTP